MISSVAKKLFAAALLTATALTPTAAMSETLMGALAKAYELNSSLNYNRAGVRVTDENVPIAKSGWRPTIGASGSIDYTSAERTLGSAQLTTGSFGFEINQMLFDGFQTLNNVRSAEAQVRASFENLRNQEQNTLFDAASAYMDVIRDRQIAVLTEQNLQFLTEQARAARSRFEVGEGTRTDVAQADASRSQAIAQLASARAQAEASEASYLQVVGEKPGRLQAGQPLGKMLPKNLDSAITTAAADHPAILATEHLVDSAAFTVKSTEGRLLPQVSASAGLRRNYQNTEGLPGVGTSDGTFNSATVGATLTVPIYTGGRTSAEVRQSKESLGQARIQVDVSRDQVRQAVTSAWTQYIAAREGVTANREQVAAQQLALNGVIEERNVGQRTTLDVLNAQADVISAQIQLVSAQRDVVVASYAIISAVGALTAERLGLAVDVQRPQEHYDAVKNKLGGVRTPDGR